MADASVKHPTESGQQARREMEQRLQEQMGQVRYKLVVLSGKGGVGKSTVAANLAVVLADEGNLVGLLDVDVHGPSIPRLMGLESNTVSGAGGCILPIRARERLWVMSIGFLLKSNRDAVIWRGPLKFRIIQQFLSDVAWGPLDYLVIDSPPGTGDEPLSVAQLVGRPAAAVIVTTPQELAICDVRRCVTFCTDTSLAIAGIVENMSGYVCPHCGTVANLFGAGGGRRLAEEMNVPFLGQILLNPEIVTSGDCGRAFVNSEADSASAAAFREIVKHIERFVHDQAPIGSEIQASQEVIRT